MGDWDFSGIDEIYKNNIPAFLKIIEYALKHANPSPIETDFHVYGAAAVKVDLVQNEERRFDFVDFHSNSIEKLVIVAGGNLERGSGVATHCEESLETSISVILGNNKKTKIIVIVAGDPDNLAYSCGNCRDVLKTIITPDTILVTASPKGGKVDVRKASDLYFGEEKMKKETFLVVSPNEDKTYHQRVYGRLNEAIERSISFGKNENRYSVVIEFENSPPQSSFYFGSIAFKPSLGIINNLINLMNEGNPHLLKIKRIHVGVVNNPDNIPYADRQHLYDFVDYIREANIRQDPIPINIYNLNSGYPPFFWETDSDEWLPLPFSARNLGAGPVLNKYMKLWHEKCGRITLPAWVLRGDKCTLAVEGSKYNPL
jgi:cytidine deaminase